MLLNCILGALRYSRISKEILLYDNLPNVIIFSIPLYYDHVLQKKRSP